MYIQTAHEGHGAVDNVFRSVQCTHVTAACTAPSHPPTLSFQSDACHHWQAPPAAHTSSCAHATG
eukprot:scaffold200112_cov18-Tisochrysis_lutea.AAC.1